MVPGRSPGRLLAAAGVAESRYNGAVRIAAYYFALFVSVGLILPYLPPYYRSLGFDGREIALLASIHPLLGIAVPPLWGYAADRTRRPVLLLRVASAGTALAFVPLLLTRQYGLIAAALVFFSLCATPLGALADSIAVPEARRLRTDFARLRLWGSLGFAAASWAFGQWLGRGGAAADVVPAIVATAALFALVSFSLRPTSDVDEAERPSLADALELLRRPAILLFLGSGFLHWMAFAPYHLFFAVHIEGLGAGAGLVGAAFAAAVLAEVVAMWRFPDLARRLSLEGLLVVCHVVGGVRWGLTATLADGTAVAALQLLHGFTFGVFFVACMRWLDREVPARLRATGRALFASLVTGIGAVAGNNLAGALFDAAGSAAVFRAAAIVSLLAPLLVVAAARARAREAREARLAVEPI